MRSETAYSITCHLEVRTLYLSPASNYWNPWISIKKQLITVHDQTGLGTLKQHHSSFMIMFMVFDHKCMQVTRGISAIFAFVLKIISSFSYYSFIATRI